MNVKGKLPPTTAQAVLREVYLSNLGMGLDKSESPLYGVLKLPEEDNAMKELLSDKYLVFVRLKIRELFGITVDEFLSRPREELKIMLEVASKILEEKNHELERQQEELKGLLDTE